MSRKKKSSQVVSASLATDEEVENAIWEFDFQVRPTGHQLLLLKKLLPRIQGKFKKPLGQPGEKS